MTREEAKAEINKVFEPAFANYIITALTEGATPSECKTGRWIRIFPDNDFKCSVCGNFIDFDGVNAGRGDANYCPNCGAKMEGAEE